MNRIVHDALILTGITLISGVSLGFVNNITEIPIKNAQEAATKRPIKRSTRTRPTLSRSTDLIQRKMPRKTRLPLTFMRMVFRTTISKTRLRLLTAQAIRSVMS